MLRFILLLFVITFLAGCDSDLLRAPPPPLGAKLMGDEIKTRLSGNSLTTVKEETTPLSIFFAENGEMRGLRSYSYRDHGTWEVKNDTLCGNWNNWYGTLANCWEVFRSGNRFTLKRVGDQYTASAILAAGNAVGV